MDRCEALQYEIAILEQSILDAQNFKHTAYDDVPELIVVQNLPRINSESAKKETGGKIGSKKDISPSLVSKKGPSVEKAAEQIVEKYGSGGEAILTKDESWVRDEIIQILQLGKANYKKDILADIKELKLKVLELEKELKSSCLGNEGFGGFFMSREEVLKEAIEFQNTRSKRARAIDEKSGNKRRLSPTAENLLRWMKNPSKFDLIGVDAYRAKRPTADLEIDLETWWRGQRLPDKPKSRKKKPVDIKKAVSAKKKSSSNPKKSSDRIYTNDELYVIANEILTPKKIKFTLDKSKIDENLELFTITPNTRSVKDGSLDGLEILYYPKERYFEAVEQMAGPKENQLWIYKTTKSPRIAIKQILKGNNRKKDVEKVIR